MSKLHFAVVTDCVYYLCSTLHASFQQFVFLPHWTNIVQNPLTMKWATVVQQQASLHSSPSSEPPDMAKVTDKKS